MVAAVALAALATGQALAQSGGSLFPPPGSPQTGPFRIDPESSTLIVDCPAPSGRFPFESQSVAVNVLDNPDDGWTEITIEVFAKEPRTGRWSMGSLDRYEIRFCGRNGNFDYNMATGVSKLTRAKSFSITGGNGFDIARINLASNMASGSVVQAAPVTIDFDLGGSRDDMQIRLRPGQDGALALTGDLGPGPDTMTIMSYRGIVTGVYDIAVAGNTGTDDIVSQFSQPIDLRESGRLRVRLSGDTLPGPGQASPLDNIADHNSDLVVATFVGSVLGTLEIDLTGDDGVQRFRDLACLNVPGGLGCAFRSPASRLLACRGAFWPPTPTPRNGPCDLEEALTSVPGYAADGVKAYIFLDAIGPQANIRADIDGGLGNDAAVMVVRAEGEIQPQRFQGRLSGGQAYRGQFDSCYVEGTPNALRARIADENCAEYDPEISDY